jgi:CO/xanthine dehydrogenase FAD-binding subunit
MWDTYLIASSVEDALTKLGQLSEDGRVIAGGTDLVLQAQRGQCLARAVVDVTRIPGLAEIQEQDGYIVIGAAATHAQVAASPLIRRTAPLLAEACASVGGPQVRNVGTLAGNVVNALPAADGAVALFALQAEAQVATLSGHTCVPIADLYCGVGECTLDRCTEMIVALRFQPLDASAGCSFQRLARRRALALPIVNAAVVVGMDEGTITYVRIAVGPVAPAPFRALAAERALTGHTPTEELIAQAAQLAARDARPRSSVLRGSAAYRTEMVEVLVQRGLRAASQMKGDA